MHGIVREGSHNWSREGSGVTKIVIRYSDGRVMNFVPDAHRNSFHEDDILELQKLVSHAAAAAEWGDINTRLGF